MSLAVIIPASNEEGLIGACLSALVASDPVLCGVELVVAANCCHDATVARAEAWRAPIEGRGWRLTVLDLPQGGKIGALNAADAATGAKMRLYLDADVTVSPPLLAQITAALDRGAPAYASGTLRITARGAVARAYGRLWARVPFMARGVPGCGLFAVNAAGRARWAAFPQVIADDTFARLQFAPEERTAVPATYDWPIAEGFGRLVRVRRRQDAGVREIAARFPQLMRNEDKAPAGAGGLMRLLLATPVAFAVYAGVALAVRLSPAPGDWSRGR